MGSPLHTWQIVTFLFLGASSMLVLLAFPLWYICKKAGFSPWLTLLNCLPFGTPVLLYLLAFADWKRRPMFAEHAVPVAGEAAQTAAVNKPIPIRQSIR